MLHNILKQGAFMVKLELKDVYSEISGKKTSLSLLASPRGGVRSATFTRQPFCYYPGIVKAARPVNLLHSSCLPSFPHFCHLQADKNRSLGSTQNYAAMVQHSPGKGGTSAVEGQLRSLQWEG